MPPPSWPALQLVSAQVAPFAHGRALTVGALVPLGPGLTVGAEGDLRVAGVQRQHCRIEKKSDVMRLWHYGSAFRTSVNGQPRLEADLQHRDLIGLTGGTLFRVLESPPVEAHDAALEAAVDAAPDADEPLSVWQDFLLEAGDPLGARIAAGRAGEPLEHAPWLDAWAAHFVSGRLQVQWHAGLARSASIREPSISFASLGQGLEKFFSLRVMRAVRALRLELSTEKVFDARLVESLATVKWPAGVSMHLGLVPATEWSWFEPARERLAKQLQRPVEAQVYGAAELEVLNAAGGQQYRAGEKVPVNEQLLLGRTGLSTQTGLILGGSYLLRRDGHRYVLDQLVAGAETMRVNGHHVQRFPLCDGDLLELGGDFSAKFSLVLR